MLASQWGWFESRLLSWLGFEVWLTLALLIPFTSGVLWSVRDEWGVAAQILNNLFHTIFDGFFAWFQGFLLDQYGDGSAKAFMLPTYWAPLCFAISFYLYSQRQKDLGLPLCALGV